MADESHYNTNRASHQAREEEDRNLGGRGMDEDSDVLPTVAEILAMNEEDEKKMTAEKDLIDLQEQESKEKNENFQN